MADERTDSTEEEELEVDEQVEVDQETEDETQDVDQDTETEEAEETDDDESDDEESEDEDADDESEFTKRFTQFKGDSPTEYFKNLEDGYAESSKEAVKLSRENKTLKETVERVNQLIANSPELAAAIKGAEGPVVAPPKDPAILFAETQMKQTWQKEYDSFALLHPEIETDPVLAEQLDSKLKIAKRIVEEEEGRLVGMGEGLGIAWKLLGKDTDDKQEKVSMAAKDSASQGKTSGGKKTQAKPKFSESQISVHMEMTGLERSDAIKQLSEYVK